MTAPIILPGQYRMLARCGLRLALRSFLWPAPEPGTWKARRLAQGVLELMAEDDENGSDRRRRGWTLAELRNLAPLAVVTTVHVWLN